MTYCTKENDELRVPDLADDPVIAGRQRST
ncbi:hypothetical protein QFZ23_003861 [Arthrobacter globiformis]|nr:hypothetical protein [Arthrobacter globiformis]